MTLEKNKPDVKVFTETYSSKGVETDKRCRGDNPVIGEIENLLKKLRGKKVCVFSNLGIDPRELSDGDDFFYKYCFARMFSNGTPVQLRLRGKYSLDGILTEDLCFGESCEHQGSFVGEVRVGFAYNEKANNYDLQIIRNAITSSGLERK